MKLIELPKSPYWGGNIHVGYYPDGTKRYSPKSSKVRRDPSAINEHGGREDRIRAMKVLTTMQDIANQGMEIRKERSVVMSQEYEEMLTQLLRSVGLTRSVDAPAWVTFSDEVLDRHCRDLSAATVRSYKSKKSVFDKWLASAYSGKKSKLAPQSKISEFRLDDVQEFYDWRLTEGGQSATANAAIKCLSMIFARAIVADHITKNPCAGVSKRFGVSKSKQPFTVGDFSKITGALVEHREEIEFAEEWSLAIRFAIFTGARLSDCVSLRWSDFSEDFRRVNFLPKKKERLHSLGKVDATVTMILPEFLATVFSRARDASASEWVTPALRVIPAGKWGHGARFRQILDLAGVEYSVLPSKGSRGNAQCSHGFHSFRHSLKTELRAAGVSAESSNFLTGHDDAKVAARYVTEKVEVVFRECSGVFAEFEAAIRA